MFPAMMYVLHLEKCKMQKIKNHNIATKKIGLMNKTTWTEHKNDPSEFSAP